MIGIVGGMGSYAGIDLFRKILDNTAACVDQEHLDIVLISVPSRIKDRSEYLLGKTGENPAFAIAKVLLSLNAAGATVAGIPCSTAHSDRIFKIISDELRKKKATLKLLNMVAETIEFIKVSHPDIKTVGVLSTTGAYREGVYSKELQLGGYEVILPPKQMQEKLVHPAIYDPEYGIKSHPDPIHPQALENLHRAISFLKMNGAQAVVLGCTELPLAFPENSIDGMITIDPTTILARALISNCCPDKLRPAKSHD